MHSIHLVPVFAAEASGNVRVELDLVIYTVMGFFAGIFFFFKGFRDLKTKRTVEDIPTSRIATGAVGTDVEICGTILCDENRLLTAPLSGDACVFYVLEIEKLTRSRNSSHWIKIDTLHSDEGFYVDDGSGATALVFAEGAQIIQKGKGFVQHLDRYLRGEVKQRLKQVVVQNLKELKTFGVDDVDNTSGKYRVTEKRFMAGEEVYILGFADSGLKLAAQRKLDFKTFLKAKKLIIKHPKLKQRFDRDEDGVLNPDELEWGAKVIGQRMTDKYNEEQFKKLYSKTKMIFKHAPPSLFLISTHHEADVLGHLTLHTRLKLFGGPALSIGCAVYLITIYDDLMKFF
ncbi:hypothetical protein [Nitrospina watsonii]|uniref:EF-hand domain-containing protein n=1 Tax=Nitrospina watsonii TaxID=1323948 RepID=A0ABM9HFI4_9BACT|nr:hypothetical protein [Nitrospina watsonii]CAI2718823.1 EF-hand domain-containing protein [Nitrospina watsonii]